MSWSGSLSSHYRHQENYYSKLKKHKKKLLCFMLLTHKLTSRDNFHLAFLPCALFPYHACMRVYHEFTESFDVKFEVALMLFL